MRVVIPTRAQMRKVRREVDVSSMEFYKGYRYDTRTKQNHPYYIAEIDLDDPLFSYFYQNEYLALPSYMVGMKIERKG